MAFSGQTFPYFPMLHGITKTIIDPVSVVSNGNREYRMKRQAWERYEWTIPVQTMTVVQKETIKSFLLQRQHSLDSFLFVDQDAKELIGAELSYYTTGYWKYNLPINMVSQNVAGTHPLFGGAGTVITYGINGGIIANAGNISVIDGIPLILTGYGPPNTIRVSAPIKFVVRLASTLSYTLAALDSNNETLGTNTAAIKLIEVHGEHN